MSKYQVMPELSIEEFEALKQDIKERGVQVPVEYDEEGNILDGYHRVRACEELAIEKWPSVVRVGLTEKQKIEHAYKLNMQRRQVSKEFKKEKAAELRENGWRQERISSVLGVPQQTISRWLNEFTHLGKLKQPETITGKDGKEYPATKLKKAYINYGRVVPSLECPYCGHAKWDYSWLDDESWPETIQCNNCYNEFIYDKEDFKENRKSTSVFTNNNDVNIIGEISKKAPDKLDDIAEGKRTAGRVESELRRDERNSNKTAPPEDNNKYRIIYADPPWRYGNSGLDEYGHAERHYDTMTVTEICELPVKDIALDDSVLFLWATSPFLEDAFKVINAWGFNYKTSFIWDKVKHNFGYYNSVRHEILLVATRGSCLPDNKKLYDSVVSIERTDKHSQKPEEFRNIIDDIYKEGRRIELFARETPNGWDVWGNEV